MSKRVATCAECGSESISGRGEDMYWDYDKQEWLSGSMIVDIECGDCGDLVAVEWKEEDLCLDPTDDEISDTEL